MGEGGFAGGGGACNHDETDFLPGGDLRGDVADFLFHHGLVGQNQRRSVALGDGRIQFRHVGCVQGLRAKRGFVKLPENLFGGLEVSQPPGVLLGGQTQDKAVFKQFQAEAFDIAGIGHHVAVEIIHKAVQGIDVDVGIDPEAEELGLVNQSVLTENLHGVVRAEGLFFNGQGLGRQLPHTGFHPFQQGFVQGEIALGQDKKRAAEGVFHRNALHVFPARHVVKGFQHQKDRAALIGLDTGLIQGGDHPKGAVPVQDLVKLAKFSVPVDQQDIAGRPVLKVRRNGLIRGSAGIDVFLAVHSNLQQIFFFHGMASFMYLRGIGLLGEPGRFVSRGFSFIIRYFAGKYKKDSSPFLWGRAGFCNRGCTPYEFMLYFGHKKPPVRGTTERGK